MGEILLIIVMLTGIVLVLKFGERPNLNNCKTDYKSLALQEIEEQRKQERLKKEEEERLRAEEELKQKSEKLNVQIQEAINLTKSQNIKLLLQDILNSPVKDKSSLIEKKWLFNNGKLRTLEEIETHEHELRRIFLEEHPEYYNKMCNDRNIKYGVVGFMIGCFSVAFTEINKGLLGLPCLFTGLLGVAFAECISHSTNIKYAEEINFFSDKVYKEKTALNTYTTGSAASGLYLLHHTKKSLKEISNPDSWKEMK